jgi:hypothetical protein
LKQVRNRTRVAAEEATKEGGMSDMPIDPEYEERGQTNIRDPERAYRGDSDRKDHSDWRDLHLAVQRAAKAAAADLAPGDEAWFEVSRLRVLVGNPNVKIYSATLTSTTGGDS